MSLEDAFWDAFNVNYAVYSVNSYHIARGARSMIANVSFEERGKAIYM